MDDSHRKYIRNYINELVANTKYAELMKECVQTRLISNTMCAQIEGLPDAKEKEKHKELFIKLTKRGPTAYEELIQICIKLRFPVAATLLRCPKHDDSQYISMHQRSTINTPPIAKPKNAEFKHTVPEGCYPSKDRVDAKLTLVPFNKTIPLSEHFEVKKSKTIHNDPKVPFYAMKSKNRGVLFSVNNIEFPNREDKKRSGAELDQKVLLHVFKEMGYTCFAYDNLSGEEFLELFEQLRNSDYLEQTDSFVMVIMSHGEMTDDMHDRVEFCDGSIFKVKDIEDLLSNEACPRLVNKPKVLVFPFCRGLAPDKGIVSIQADGISYGPQSPINTIPTRSDMIVCYASVRGFQTFREPDKGSWYIQEFCEVLAKHAHDTHLEDMLKLIAVKMRSYRSADGHLQTPAYYNHGFHKLYINPGVYELQGNIIQLSIPENNLAKV